MGHALQYSATSIQFLLVMAALLAMATAQYYWATQGQPVGRTGGFGGFATRSGGGTVAGNSVGGGGGRLVSTRTRTVRPPVVRPFYAPNPVRL